MTSTDEQALVDTSASPETGIARELLGLLDIVILLARRKRLIFGTTMLAALVALVVVFGMSNVYSAETRIMPPQQTQSASTALLGQLAPLAALAGKDIGITNPTAVYVSVLESRTIQDAIVKRFDLLKVYHKKTWIDARMKLASKARISSAAKSGVITVQVEDKDPKRAAEMANAYIEELHTVTQHLAVTEASRRRLFFEREVEQERDQLATAELDLKQIQEQTGLIQLDTQAKAIIENVARLRSQIAAKEVELKAMRSFAAEQNPDYILAQEQLAGLRQQLSKAEHDNVGGNGNTGVSTSKVPEVGLAYLRKLRDVKYHEMLFELLAKQFEAAKIDEAKDAAIIQVIDYAVPPDKRSGPQRLLLFLLITGGVGFGSCVVVVANEAWQRMKSSPECLARIQLLRSYL